MKTNESEILRPNEVMTLLGGVARSYLEKLQETDPHFPRKIVITPRLTGYRRKSFFAWLDAKEKGEI